MGKKKKGVGRPRREITPPSLGTQSPVLELSPTPPRPSLKVTIPALGKAHHAATGSDMDTPTPAPAPSTGTLLGSSPSSLSDNLPSGIITAGRRAGTSTLGRKRPRAPTNESDRGTPCPPEKPPRKSRRGAADGDGTRDAETWETNIVLLVPQAAGGGTRRKTLGMSDTFEDALSIIYNTVGCEAVQRKPILQYKLSNAPVKKEAINLDNEEDWDGLVEDIKTAQKQKKALVPINILVSDQYLKSLRAHVNDGKKAQHSSQRTKKNRKEAPLLDLNNDGDGDDDDDDGGITELEQQKYKLLEAALTRCQSCGPDKWCKTSRSGTHIALTHAQRRAWVVALATGMHGVTLSTPPRSALFEIFFGAAKKSADETTATPVPPHMPVMPFPYPMPPWPGYGYPPPPAFPTPTPIRTSVDHSIPSSDPPDASMANSFPEIDDFIRKLVDENPRRIGLLNCLEELEAKDFYHIDELLKFDVARLTSMGLSDGNAQFLLDKTRAAIKKIGKSHRK